MPEELIIEKKKKERGTANHSPARGAQLPLQASLGNFHFVRPLDTYEFRGNNNASGHLSFFSLSAVVYRALCRINNNNNKKKKKKEGKKKKERPKERKKKKKGKEKKERKKFSLEPTNLSPLLPLPIPQKDTVNRQGVGRGRFSISGVFPAAPFPPLWISGRGTLYAPRHYILIFQDSMIPSSLHSYLRYSPPTPRSSIRRCAQLVLDQARNSCRGLWGLFRCFVSFISPSLSIRIEFSFSFFPFLFLLFDVVETGKEFVRLLLLFSFFLAFRF